MINWLHSLWAQLSRRNFASTPTSVILDQLAEPRPLPIGRTEFDAWADRLIAGAALQAGSDDPAKFRDGQKFALANMIIHLGPTESHKPDAYFIHQLRKVMCNQTAHSILLEMKVAQQARADAHVRGTPVTVANSTENSIQPQTNPAVQPQKTDQIVAILEN